jgi:spore germination protein YaaH
MSVRLKIFLSVSCLGFHLPVFAKNSQYFGWVASYEKVENYQALLTNMSHFESLWFVGPSGKNLLSDDKTWWDNTGVFKDITAEAKARKISFGPVIHNAHENGFDGALGAEIVKKSSSVIAKLLKESKVHQWKVINVDLESLPESAAEDYENFLLQLNKTFSKEGIKISVCLHAKVSATASFEGARFQRWEKLKKIKVDYIVMAYDYSWAQSSPGAIAPFSWVEKVVDYSTKQFSAQRVILGLPLFGYKWNRDVKTASGWLGLPDTALNLNQLVQSKEWIRDDKVPQLDGVLFRKGTDSTVAFDNETTFFEKIKNLEKKKVKRFAIWRLGAEQESFYKKIESLHVK